MQPFLMEKPVAHSTASKFSAVLIGVYMGCDDVITFLYILCATSCCRANVILVENLENSLRRCLRTVVRGTVGIGTQKI